MAQSAGRDGVGLVVDDHQRAVVLAVDQVDEALQHVPSSRTVPTYVSRQCSRAAARRTTSESSADRTSAVTTSVYSTTPFGHALRGDGVVQAGAGGQVDHLQDAVHGPADRGAVAALRPRRQLEVAGALRRARRRRPGPRAGIGALQPGRALRRRSTGSRPRAAVDPAPATRSYGGGAAGRSATAAGPGWTGRPRERHRAGCRGTVASASSSALLSSRRAPRCSDTTRWSRARVRRRTAAARRS